MDNVYEYLEHLKDLTFITSVNVCKQSSILIIYIQKWFVRTAIKISTGGLLATGDIIRPA